MDKSKERKRSDNWKIEYREGEEEKRGGEEERRAAVKKKTDWLQLK